MSLRHFCEDAWIAFWQWWHDLRVALGFRKVETRLTFHGRYWIFTTIRAPKLPQRILISAAPVEGFPII